MQNTFLKISVLTALMVAPWVAKAQEKAEIDAAILAVKPALVRIYVAEVTFEQGREEKMESAGSGAIISEDGYVVTNHHVAGWAKRLVVTLTDKTVVEADLVGTDPLTDISVLKLRRTADRKFPFAKWGDSSKMQVGDTVLAMGSPLALSQSVTKGIISNTEMVMPDFLGSVNMSLDGEDVGAMVLWIGHDAQISPGNSGGPLVNLAGEIIGINELEFGLSGAIPSNLAKEVASALIADGKVRRSTIGISVQPLLKSSERTTGVLVNSTNAGGPAAKAGLQPGDLILKIGDQETNVRFAEQLPEFNRLVAGLPIGKDVQVAYERNGEAKTTTVQPIEREPVQPRPSEIKSFGIVVSNISPSAARDLKRESTDGVMVESIRAGGPAGNIKPQMRSGDIVVAFNGKPMKNIAEFRKAVDDAVKPELLPTTVTMEVERGREQLLVVSKIDNLDDEDQSREARKAFLGASTQVLLPEIAKALGVEGRKGFRVTGLVPGSPAEKAGLKVGDLVFAIDDIVLEASQAEDAEELAEIVRQYDIGSDAALKVWRAGKIQDLKVKLGTSPTSSREMKKHRDEDFEFSVRDLSEQDRNSQQLGTVSGVLVDEVSQGGWAALGKLASGDLVLSVGGKPVSNVDEFEKAMSELKAQKVKAIVLRVLRGTQELFIEMEADWSTGR